MARRALFFHHAHTALRKGAETTEKEEKSERNFPLRSFRASAARAGRQFFWPRQFRRATETASLSSLMSWINFDQRPQNASKRFCGVSEKG